MTETWLYASRNQRWPPVATSSTHSGPLTGRSRGGGIVAIMFKSALSDSISMPFNSFESVELRISNDYISLGDLFMSSPSQQAKQTVKQNVIWSGIPAQRWFLNTVMHIVISRLLVILTFILKTVALPMAMLTSWRLCWTTTIWFSSWTCRRTSEAMSWTGP